MDQLTVQEALPAFYKTYQLETDGGINNPTVKITLAKGVYIYIPNFEARKKVVLKHDIHHLITGYEAVMKGETEVSAWELSTGCHQNWVAFTLNLFGLMLGVLFNTKRVWKAWLKGKQTSNLYDERYKMHELMSRKVGDIKSELGFQNENQKSDTLKSLSSFIGFLILGALFSIASWIFIPFILFYSIFISIQKKWTRSFVSVGNFPSRRRLPWLCLFGQPPSEVERRNFFKYIYFQLKKSHKAN